MITMFVSTRHRDELAGLSSPWALTEEATARIIFGFSIEVPQIFGSLGSLGIDMHVWARSPNYL